MKRNIVIAVVTAAALVGGGTATALAVAGDDDAPASRSARTLVSDDDGRDDDRDHDRGDDHGGREDGDDRGRGDDGRDGHDDDRDDGRVASGDVTAAEAIAAALRHTPGTAVSAELDHEDDEDDAGTAVWEVEILGKGDAWRSVWVDPASGKVLSARGDDEDDAAEVRAALKGASVSAEEAAKAAAAKGTVTSVDLDDDGDKGWEVETAGDGEWKVGLDRAEVTADRDDSGDDDSDDRDDD